MSDVKIYYATIFDINYVVRALTLYNSILENLSGNVLAFFCVDDESAELLSKLSLPNSVVVPPRAYETPVLSKLRRERARGPYCWTLKPYALQYGQMNYPSAEWLVYIDADMMGFGDPAHGLPKDQELHAIITPHRFATPEFMKYESVSGQYNAGFAAFRNTDVGMRALEWWRDLCETDCSGQPGDGTLGDQMYLDDMVRLFPGIYSSPCKGLNAAPWNIQAYKVTQKNGSVYLDDEALLLYHFQGLDIFGTRFFDLYAGNLKLPASAVEHIYRPYMRSIRKSFEILRGASEKYTFGADPFLSRPRRILAQARQYVRGYGNLAVSGQ